MPTLLPERARARRATPEPTFLLICLVLWTASLAVVFVDGSGSNGDLAPALAVSSP